MGDLFSPMKILVADKISPSGIDFLQKQAGFEVLEAFENDPDTEAVVMIGEIGGSAEEEAAAYIKTNMKKPVVAYIAGVKAPPGKRMGHAGAIVSGNAGTAKGKMEALQDAGAKVAQNPTEIGGLVKEVLGR